MNFYFKLKALIIVMLLTAKLSNCIAQIECNNRWTGVDTKLTFRLKNDTIYDLNFPYEGSIHKYDSVALNNGKFLVGHTICNPFPGPSYGISISGSLSIDKKSFTGVYTHCQYRKISESPDTWDYSFIPSNWSAFPDTTLPLQPSEITGPDSVCLGHRCLYEIVHSNVSYDWSAKGGTIERDLNHPLTGNSIYVRWDPSGTRTITVTPYNGCGIGPSKTLNVDVFNPPVFTNIINGERCREGSVTLEGVVNEGIISWYGYEGSNHKLGEGTIFTTPILKESTSYYAQAVSDKGCKTLATKIDAVIHGLINKNR